MRDELGHAEKPQTLMDMAFFLVVMSVCGRLDDMEVSGEINATLLSEVDVNGVKEAWLLMFRTETHTTTQRRSNHLVGLLLAYPVGPL